MPGTKNPPSLKRSRSDRTLSKPGEPCWHIDNGVINIHETARNGVRLAKFNMHNGTSVCGIEVNVYDTGVYCHLSHGAVKPDVVTAGGKESPKRSAPLGVRPPRDMLRFRNFAYRPKFQPLLNFKSLQLAAKK